MAQSPPIPHQGVRPTAEARVLSDVPSPAQNGTTTRRGQKSQVLKRAPFCHRPALLKGLRLLTFTRTDPTYLSQTDRNGHSNNSSIVS